MSIDRRRFLELGAASAATALSGCAAPLAHLPTGPSGSTAALDGKIEHFIVLMLENRSYDQMLGSLSGAEHDGVPPGVRLPYERRDGSREWLPVRHGSPPDRFAPDPSHNFQAVEAQIHGSGRDRPPDMTGFARRFLEDNPSIDAATLRAYATLYGDGHLPILQGLAKEYGVCTHWFCSLPSSTTPNRMFLHAGTSGGATRRGAYYARIRGRMIFDELGTKHLRSWRVYFHDMPHLWLTGDAWMQTFNRHFYYMHAFERDVRLGQLATYTFIEPQHILPPWSSQHPSGGVSHGERLIASVYNTLAANPAVFARSLLLIVYDEHGGFYDHVIPPGHAGWQEQCPSIPHEVVPPDDARGSGEGGEAGYGFTTLGPRVPAVVVSPWIEKGSVFGWKASDPARRRTFDHTSILATVGEMTGVWVASKRARAATTLGAVINRTSPRTDYPSRLAYDARAYRDEAMTDEPRPPDAPAFLGVAGELRDAWRATHGEGTATEMVDHVRTLVES
jgi:phospholipase C